MWDFSSSNGKHMNCILSSCRALRKFRKPGQDMLHTWAGAIMGCSRRYVRQNCEVFELQVSRIQQISSPPPQPLSRYSGWNSVDTGQCTAPHCICARGETELRGEGRSRYNGDDAPLESPNFAQIAISMSSKKLVACISRYFHVWRIKMYPKQAK